MPALRRITRTALQYLKGLLADNTALTRSIAVNFQGYAIEKKAQDGISPLHFQWLHRGQTEPLFFSFHTWGTAESQKYPDTFLALGTATESRLVGFPLYLLPQDKECVYLSFKLGNNEGGKNRWFGRGRTANERRTVAQTDQLAADIRQALQRVFPEPLFAHPTLAGEWLTLARLPLADLNPQAEPVRRGALKTLVLEQLLQAFVIAEKLRDDSLAAVGMSPATFNAPSEEDLPALMNPPLNQILYGPPGTGKTYHTALRAIGVLEDLSDEAVQARYPTREALRAQYDAYQRTGRIQFVTFHQSFGYEDFVEGIKPVLSAEAPEAEEAQALGYVIADGVFKTMAYRSTYALHLQQLKRLATTASGPPAALDFDTVFERFIEHLRERHAEETVVFHTKKGSPLELRAISAHGTAYFRYAAGNGTNQLQVTRDGLRRINNDNPVDAHGHVAEAAIDIQHGRDKSVYWAAFREFVNFRSQLQATVPTPAPGAEASVEEGLQRVLADPQIASEIALAFDFQELAEQDFAQAPRFVLIIDEINRGNVASIFGELITLLEDSKRAGQPEHLTAKLPYSKTDFTVPANLFLLGTMNTADRSVEALDTALRRRFAFTEMRPEADVLREHVGTNGVIGAGEEAIDVAHLLDVLNSRLEQLLDHDHCLGHALLLLPTPDVDGLRRAFQRNILPLLQEYFFGDWGKIGLVLGPKFVEVVKPKDAGRYPLATFPGYDTLGLRDKPLYRLTRPESWDASTFQSIFPSAS